MIDFGKELDIMRSKYCSAPLKRLKLPKDDHYMKDPAFRDCYREVDHLIHSGRICYAFIVQANNMLYMPFLPVDSLAVTLFSDEEWVNRDPMFLAHIARDLYQYKGKPAYQIPPQLRGAVAVLENEYDFSSHYWSIENREGETAQLCMKTSVIFRKYLPGLVLKAPFVPVFADIRSCRSIITLPKEYWSDAFLAAWKNKSMPS